MKAARSLAGPARREAPSSCRRRRRRPKGRSRRSRVSGGTEPARRPLSVQSQVIGGVAGRSSARRSRPRRLARPQGKAFPYPIWFNFALGSAMEAETSSNDGASPRSPPNIAWSSPRRQSYMSPVGRSANDPGSAGARSKAERLKNTPACNLRRGSGRRRWRRRRTPSAGADRNSAARYAPLPVEARGAGRPAARTVQDQDLVLKVSRRPPVADAGDREVDI